jgi:HSP20 family protein
MTNRSLANTLDRMMSMNRAIDEAFSTGFSNGSRAWAPAIDVVEKPEAYLVYAELPGVPRDQVELAFEQNVLTLRGTKPATLSGRDEEIRVFAAERAHGTFERSLRLPEFVDGERITAEFTDGLLAITIPKAQAAQPRRIQIGG